MPVAELTDHSSNQSASSPAVASASNLILIDNYDSFTWNVYQYLVLEGATVQVYRNDEVTLEELVAKKPTQLVVSPGPGHPETDAGISKDAIAHFSGKIPVLGVCMGEQCIFSVFGGKVDVTGEILHGKTSPLRHDSKGVYANLPQDLPVTRYHSLAGTHQTLPQCLEVSSWIASGPDGGKGVIMGVRHKDYLVEGVQFHPESILTEKGRIMLSNFLKMRGGTWEENERLSQSSTTTEQQANGINGVSHPAAIAKEHKDKTVSVLERIYEHRKASVSQQKLVPSQRPEDLRALYELDICPPLVSFADRLRQSPYSISLMAEIKRASPSKGVISLSTCAPAQARKYAVAGASVISVLTEPEWFKGCLDDLRAVRQSLEGMCNRPAVLRKDFIFDEYQILEARLAGADSVLLIVKMLDLETLTRLYRYSQSLGMEPLVEVNTVEEMQVAVELGSRVIGVNNRNLTSFEVDMSTTSRLLDQVPAGTVVCALSGILEPQDVEPYQRNGVGAVLVGEALMKAADPGLFIARLLGAAVKPPQGGKRPLRPLVKICGTRTPESAKAAIDAGAALVGMILAKGRRRCVSNEPALQISQIVHGTTRPHQYDDGEYFDQSISATDFFSHTSKHYFENSRRALLVGVFQNQPLSYVLEQQKLLDLDVVQLHGSEPIEWASLIPVPVLRAFKPSDIGIAKRGYHALPLVDSGVGGTGEMLDLGAVRELLAEDEGLRIFIAGGLNSENVKDALTQLGPYADRVTGVDVSSGVEEDGLQSIEKIRAFICAANEFQLPG